MGEGIGLFYSPYCSWTHKETEIKKGEANATQEEIEDFNTSINRLYSISGVSLILLNVIPGCILDYSKNRSETIGIGIFKGYCILINVSFVFNTAASIMQGFQNTSIGKCKKSHKMIKNL